eukprot:SAG31_NODE_17415_length_671_cov_1.393357_2_plen_100_part_01
MNVYQMFLNPNSGGLARTRVRQYADQLLDKHEPSIKQARSYAHRRRMDVQLTDAGVWVKFHKEANALLWARLVTTYDEGVQVAKDHYRKFLVARGGSKRA